MKKTTENNYQKK